MEKIIGVVAESGVSVFAGVFLIGAVTAVLGPAVQTALQTMITTITNKAVSVS